MQPANPNPGGSVLLCYIEGFPEPPEVEAILHALSVLHRRRSWLVAKPEFVNEGEDDDRTLGLLLRLPTPDARDVSAERAALADVEALVAAAELITSTTNAELAFELDGVVVGWVATGARDRMLDQGFLKPWRDKVDQPT